MKLQRRADTTDKWLSGKRTEGDSFHLHHVFIQRVLKEKLMQEYRNDFDVYEQVLSTTVLGHL